MQSVAAWIPALLRAYTGKSAEWALYMREFVTRNHLGFELRSNKEIITVLNKKCKFISSCSLSAAHLPCNLQSLSRKIVRNDNH
jgi:hypothetical protein